MMNPENRSRMFAARTVLLAGLVAGILDLVAAVIVNLPRGIEPLSILQSIASGLLGRDTYSGGWSTAMLGVALHFAMMLIIATIYVLAARHWSALKSRAIASGISYGVIVYFVMNLVVLPLSAFPHDTALSTWKLATGLPIHILLVGIPIALIAARQVKTGRE